MSQIFQNSYPKQDFFDYLKKYCDNNNSCYTFSKEAFKRIKLDENIDSFL